MRSINMNSQMQNRYHPFIYPWYLLGYEYYTFIFDRDLRDVLSQLNGLFKEVIKIQSN